jgi:hypothetical protein
MQPEVATGETSSWPSTIVALTEDAPQVHGV